MHDLKGGKNRYSLVSEGAGVDLKRAIGPSLPSLQAEKCSLLREGRANTVLLRSLH